MAQNFTMGSFFMELTPEQSEWGEGLYLALENYLDEGWEPPSEYVEFVNDFTSWNDYLGFRVENYLDNGLLIYEEDFLHPDQAGWFAHAILVQFDLDREIEFTYAWTCSKARPGEFGGGGVLVAKGNVRSIDMSIGVKELIEAHEAWGWKGVR